MNILFRLWNEYPALQASVGSLVAFLWFLGGIDELRKGRKTSSVGWMLISGTMLVFVIVGNGIDGHWVAAMIGMATTAIEIWLVAKRWPAESRP